MTLFDARIRSGNCGKWFEQSYTLSYQTLRASKKDAPRYRMLRSRSAFLGHCV